MYGIKVDMEDGNANTYLAQIPLTVSPFVSLPTATTLPYTYKSIPSTLPPSATGDYASTPKPKFVVSPSGHAAHPDDILASCQSLKDHVQKTQAEAEAAYAAWSDTIRDRELAEKRRVAPGWLDRSEKLLEPQRTSADAQNVMDMQEQMVPGRSLAQEREEEGEALDRAFGGMSMQ